MGIRHLLAFVLQIKQLSLQHQIGSRTLYTVNKPHGQCLLGKFHPRDVGSLCGHSDGRLRALTSQQHSLCSQSAGSHERLWVGIDPHDVSMLLSVWQLVL